MLGSWRYYSIVLQDRRSGTAKAANGATVVPIVAVGRIDGAGAVEVEVVGVGAVRVRSRGPVVAVVAGVGEQVAGSLVDVAAPEYQGLFGQEATGYDISHDLYFLLACSVYWIAARGLHDLLFDRLPRADLCQALGAWS